MSWVPKTGLDGPSIRHQPGVDKCQWEKVSLGEKLPQKADSWALLSGILFQVLWLMAWESELHNRPYTPHSLSVVVSNVDGL